MDCTIDPWIELIRKPHSGLQLRLLACACVSLLVHTAEGMPFVGFLVSAQKPQFRSQSRFPDEF